MRRLDLVLNDLAVARRLVEVDRRVYELAFSLVVTVVLGFVIVEASGYDLDAAIVPVLVSVPAFAIMVSVLVTLLVPKLDSSLESDPDSGGPMSGVGEEDEEPLAVEPDPTAAEVQPDDPRYKLLAFLVWLGVLLVTFIVLGFTTGSIVFLLLFYRYQAGQGWRRTVGYSLAIWLFVVALFVFVLNTRLYTGLIVQLLT